MQFGIFHFAKRRRSLGTDRTIEPLQRLNNNMDTRWPSIVPKIIVLAWLLLSSSSAVNGYIVDTGTQPLHNSTTILGVGSGANASLIGSNATAYHSSWDPHSRQMGAFNFSSPPLGQLLLPLNETGK